MRPRPQIPCIGAVLWDVIGHTWVSMPPGADRPGRIHRRPGGVAMNVAAALAREGRRPALLGQVGTDAEGEALIAAAAALGAETGFLVRDPAIATDVYMAVEGPEGLVAAIADTRGLEAAGAAILEPLGDGRLGSAAAPFSGLVVLDGNLTTALLAEIAASPLFAAADLRLAQASPGKAERLRPFLAHPGATLYVNLEEAGLIAGASFVDAPAAAAGLVARGARRALVTDGARAAADCGPAGAETAIPRQTVAAHVTGAGDAFMAAHIAAELRAEPPGAALIAALKGAARHLEEGP
ncbi:kinase [Pikeienuella piscinae]|uniref:Kinase n=1 Tax=Pikeienuella piscinae TaxID=2748098 RepID=A0A7L5C2J3_9RHOB|nr:PfkB family carbohydrate kinase [Pikeienuella piscinae]QIE56089.1 kinase [Pikeienuella piscinae]